MKRKPVHLAVIVGVFFACGVDLDSLLDDRPMTQRGVTTSAPTVPSEGLDAHDANVAMLAVSKPPKE